MALPVLSLRAAPKHAPTLRKLAAQLRVDPTLAPRLAALLGREATGDPGTRGLHNYGAFGSEAAALAVLRDRLIATLDPEALYLFGSRGQGKARPDSDFDLLVVIADRRGASALDADLAYQAVAGLGVGCDVVPCLASDFEAERDQPGTLAFEAARGRVLYRKRRSRPVRARR